MKLPVVNSQTFYGGIAVDEKLGIPHSFAYSRAIDFRKKPSKMSVLPGTREISEGNVSDLVQNIAQVPNGVRYALGDQGNVYNISTSNVFSNVAKLSNGAFGLIYRADTDALYLASNSTVSRIYKPGTTSSDFKLDKYGKSFSTDSKSYKTGGVKTYTLKAAISENDTEKCSFQPDIEPGYSIKVFVVTKGTGNWTLTLHDDANKVLSTTTVNNANLVANTFNEFVFSSEVRMLVKPNARTYHFHLTSSTGDGTTSCEKENDLSTVNFEFYASRLVTPNNGMHPMVNFAQYTCIGNERYLSVWEPLEDEPTNAQWQRHRLTFPPGYEVCGLATTDEFLVIACEKRSTNSSKSFQEGKLFIWDGSARTYNFFIDVPEGSPQSIYTYENLVYMIVNGSLMVWAGGKRLQKVKALLQSDTEFSDTNEATEVYPNMMAIRRNILLVGYPSKTNIQTIEHGVFSWGSIDKNVSQSFGYNYVISSGTRTYNGTNDLRIGCVKSFGDQLYISWRDDSKANNYGVDIVDNFSDPATTAVWENLIFDAGAAYKSKLALRLKITAKELPDGVVIKPKVKFDRATDWTYGDNFTSGTSTIMSLKDESGRGRRFYEIQWGFDIECTGTETPEILSVAFEFDPLDKEGAF